MNLSTIFCILGLVVLTTSQPLGGGWSPVDPAANSTVAIAQFALDQVNALDEASCYLAYTYIRVLKAYRQLVAGYNFGFEIEVNTTMKGLCHVHYSEGLEILKNLVVYQDFAGNRQLTQPENKESLVFEKETLSEGQDCTPTGDEGCKSDFICIGNETAVCQARVQKGEDCVLNEKSWVDDECVIGFYCQANGERMNCLQAPEA